MKSWDDLLSYTFYRWRWEKEIPPPPLHQLLFFCFCFSFLYFSEMYRCSFYDKQNCDPAVYTDILTLGSFFCSFAFVYCMYTRDNTSHTSQLISKNMSVTSKSEALFLFISMQKWYAQLKKRKRKQLAQHLQRYWFYFFFFCIIIFLKSQIKIITSRPYFVAFKFIIIKLQKHLATKVLILKAL